MRRSLPGPRQQYKVTPNSLFRHAVTTSVAHHAQLEPRHAPETIFAILTEYRSVIPET